MSTYTPPYQLTDTILSLCTEISATVKELTVRSELSAQPQLHRANRIRSVHSSLAIEHNSLTLDQVTALLNGKLVLAPQQEILEVQNAFRAYERNQSATSSHPGLSSDESGIHSVSRIRLVCDILSGASHRYRISQKSAGSLCAS